MRRGPIACRPIDDDELVIFAAKVARLKGEGLTTRIVAERLGVSVTTLNTRLRRHRALLDGALQDTTPQAAPQEGKAS